MKKGLLVAAVSIGVLLALIPGLALAGQFGPTEPTAEPGKFSVGLGYFYEQTRWIGYALSIPIAGGGTYRSSSDPYKTNSNQEYMRASYGLAKGWEAYGTLGAADFRRSETGSPSDSAKPFGGLGIKGVVYSDNMFSFGPFAQGNYYGNYKDSSIGPVRNNAGNTVGSANMNREMNNMYDVSGGLSVQVKFHDFAVYGGGVRALFGCDV